MTKTTLAKRAVRVWLAERGKNQMWLAKRLGCHYSQLSRILSGHERSAKVEAALLALTGVDLTEPEAAVRS